MDKEKIIKVLKDFRRNLESEIRVEKIVLFGSRAEGKAQKDSDVDLLIVSEDFKGLDHFERAAKLYDYWSSKLPVDFLCYTGEEFEKLRKQVTIVSEALRSGKSIEI